MDEKVYVPEMRFPIEKAPAFPNSQVWGRGGSQGPGGGQCDAANYSYPWWDNYCESRSWDMPLCPGGTGHQGQDIRPSTCEKSVHWVVAAEAGQITSTGSYAVYQVADSGTTHRYLHMNMARLAVQTGDRVNKGDRLGLVSNDFGGTPTTIHMHYDINQNIPAAGGNVYVPTYMSLVRSYEALLGVEQEPCAIVGAEGGTVDDYGPCATFFGPTQYWREEDGGEGGKFHWTNGFVADNPSNFARWSLHLAEAGEYNVEINVVPPRNRSKKARYLVRAGGEDHTITVDQSALDGWHSLGQFMFAAGGDQKVEVYDNTGESGDDMHITADAVRLTRVRPAAPDMGGNNDTAPDVGVPGTNGNNDVGGNNANSSPDAGTEAPGADGGGLSAEDIRTNRGCCAVVSGRTDIDAAPLLLGLLGGASGEGGDAPIRSIAGLLGVPGLMRAVEGAQAQVDYPHRCLWG